MDLNREKVETTAEEIVHERGVGIGVAGSDISGSGDVIALECDITDRESIKRAIQQTVIAYGGIDSVVITAGLYPVPGKDGSITDTDWDDCFRVNVKGSYLVADEVAAVWESQGLDGSMVITTSANGVVAKSGSIAYDTSKSAANHLIRELAVTLAPNIRVNGVAPATVVEGSSMFPRDRIVSSLNKYGTEPNQSDEN